MRRGRAAFAALAAAIAAVLLGSGVAAARPRPPSGPAAVIPLEPYLDGDHFVFRGRVGGHEGLYQLDTGGGLTVITPQTASIAGCKPWGRLTGFRMRGDRLDLPRCETMTIVAAGARLSPPVTGVWDLASVLPKDAPPLAGSVGLDAFGGRAVTLDLAHRRLIVETPASLRTRTAHARKIAAHVVWEVEGYAPSVMAGLDTPQGRIWLTLDSGNDAPVTLGRHVAGLLGLDPQKKGAQALETSLAGGAPLSARAFVQDLIFDGNIGVPVLRQWVVTFDVAHGRLWIAPST
jgi:hypothetical protein